MTYDEASTAFRTLPSNITQIARASIVYAGPGLGYYIEVVRNHRGIFSLSTRSEVYAYVSGYEDGSRR